MIYYLSHYLNKKSLITIIGLSKDLYNVHSFLENIIGFFLIRFLITTIYLLIKLLTNIIKFIIKHIIYVPCLNLFL